MIPTRTLAGAATAFAASLALSSCSTAGQAPAQVIQPNQDFKLKVGESASALGGSLSVVFDSVTADSRCPIGERCVWGGEARVRVWLQRGSGDRQMRELPLSPIEVPRRLDEARQGEPALRLLALEPHPMAGRVTAQDQYVITLRLGPDPAAAAER